MKCKNLEKDYVMLVNNPEIICDSDEYLYFKYYFIYPSLLLWIIIYPLFLIICMKKMKSLVEAKGTLLFGFIFLGYKKSVFFWEFWKMLLRTGLLICYELFLEQILYREIFVGTLLLFFCLKIYTI